MKTLADESSRDDFTSTLRAARGGEPEALAQLFEEFYPLVRNMVHRSLACDLRLQRPWLSSLFSTGDVVQEVFQSVLRDLDGFQGASKGAFAGYLTMVVRNRLIDSIRFHQAARRDRRRLGQGLEGVEAQSHKRGPLTRVRLSEEVQLVQQAFAEFSERERLLLRGRMESRQAFAVLASVLCYPSADAARKAFHSAQANLLIKLRRLGVAREREGGE